MPNLSGSGGRSSGVNYSISSLYDRMYNTILTYPSSRIQINKFAYSYQSVTQGNSIGSLKRIRN